MSRVRVYGRRVVLTGLGVLAGGAVAGCGLFPGADDPAPSGPRSPTASGADSPTASGTSSPAVDDPDDIGPEVGEYLTEVVETSDTPAGACGNGCQGTTVVRSQTQWDEWLALLSPAFRQDLSDSVGATDFDPQVLIVYAQSRCQEKWSLRTPAEGTVQFVIDDSEGVSCYQSFFTVKVYKLDPSEVGVHSAEDIKVLEAYTIRPRRP